MPKPKRVDELSEQLRADYRACFKGESGHRVLADLARISRFADATYLAGDAAQYRDGCRSIVLHIFDACGLLDLDGWIKEFAKK